MISLEEIVQSTKHADGDSMLLSPSVSYLNIVKVLFC